MLRKTAIAIIVMVFVASGAPSTEAPPPKLIATYRAGSDPALPAPAADFSYAVTSFTFSPDEKWIALALRPRPVGRHRSAFPDGTLLLLPFESKDTRRVQIDIGAWADFIWSPDSQSIVVSTNVGKGGGPLKVYNLRGELISILPQPGRILGFVTPQRLLVQRTKGNRRIDRFSTVDIRTSAVTTWPAPHSGQVAAVDSERGLVAMFPDSEGSKTLIVDYAAGKVIQSMKNQNQTALYPDLGCVYRFQAIDQVPECSNTLVPPRLYFAENGKALCEAALVGSFKNHPVCRDVDTGKTIAEFRDLDGGAPASASTRGSRMLLTNLNSLPGHWGGLAGRNGLGVETYGGRVVWDFRSGSVVAAWTPSMQQTGWLGFGVVNGESAPAVAISSLGHYVAEAAGDELHVYRVP